jgi:hypothetical protein
METALSDGLREKGRDDAGTKNDYVTVRALAAHTDTHFFFIRRILENHSDGEGCQWQQSEVCVLLPHRSRLP